VTGRLLVVALCFAAASGVLARASRSETVPVRESFATFPMQVGAWSGERAPDFDEAIQRELGVDEYLNAIFEDGERHALGLYVGYYASQRHGDAIHSPANCLPGAGWQPVESGRVTIDVGRPIEVNRWVIQKGEERQLVLYWYQSHGRVVASEYASKVHLVLDAIRLNRTDAALVRVIRPIGRDGDSRASAEAAAISFVRSLFPILERFLPA
jgi:EpsI family protein